MRVSRVAWLRLPLALALGACSSDDGSPPANSTGGGGESASAGRGGASGGSPASGGTAGVTGGTSTGGTSAGGAAAGGAGAGSAGDSSKAGSGGVATAGTGGTSGANAGGAGGPAKQWDWPTYDEAKASPLSTPVLVVLLDFSDSDMSDLFDNPEAGWSDLVFGTQQAQGNHYWYQNSGGQFQLLKAAEQGGTPDNGVVSVKLSTPTPSDGMYVVQDQLWIPEALDLAAADVDFAAFDKNGDTIIQNRELSVMFVLNLNFQLISGAGAEANILLGHPIAGSGVQLEKFARVQYDYTSIGVPMHELGHHILDLKHAPAPSEHDLMGLGSYAEDPVITVLHDDTDHYSTRPTGPTGLQKMLGGLVKPTLISDTTRGLQLFSPETGKAYNLIELATKDGRLFLENRSSWSYDQSIPFCDGDQGGLFPTDVSQYLSPLNIPAIAREPPLLMFDTPDESFCEFYAHAGRTPDFVFGGWKFENISAPGPVMTLDIVKNEIEATIEHYKFRYWVINPDKEGYRMWRRVEAVPGGNASIDFATFPFGDDATGYFTISLEAYYSTGEVRSLNALTSWESDSAYVSLNSLGTFQNPGAVLEDAIIQIQVNTAATPTDSATVNVTSGSFQTSFTLINIPAP